MKDLGHRSQRKFDGLKSLSMQQIETTCEKDKGVQVVMIYKVKEEIVSFFLKSKSKKQVKDAQNMKDILSHNFK